MLRRRPLARELLYPLERIFTRQVRRESVRRRGRLLLLALLTLLLLLAGLEIRIPVDSLRLRSRLGLRREDLLLGQVLIVCSRIVECAGSLRL